MVPPSALASAKHALETRVADEGLQTACFISRRTLPIGSQPEITAAFVVFAMRGRRFLDEAVGQKTPQRSIEIAREQRLAAQPFLDLPDEAPAVARLRRQGEKNFEDEGFQTHRDTSVRPGNRPGSGH